MITYELATVTYELATVTYEPPMTTYDYLRSHMADLQSAGQEGVT